MTLGTWNLQRAASAARRERLKAAIGNQLADVWVFTESQTDFGLGAEFVGHCRSTPGRDDPADPKQREDCWVSIHSRFPLNKLETTDAIRTAAARISPSEAAPFLIFGTVLPWLGSEWRGFEATDGRAFRAALAVQAADWKRLQRLFPKEELFVLGDFNQDLGPGHFYGSKANRAALEQALVDCGMTALTSGDHDPVWHEARPQACIDHICAPRESRWSAEARTRWPETAEPDKALSDHFGVAVTLTLKAGPTRT